LKRLRPLRRRSILTGIHLLFALGLLLFPSQARAGGGAHFIDDATVETPGVCHLESWVTGYDGERGLLNSSPACTSMALPRLEIGGAITHFWDSTDDTHVGPALKLKLLAVESGFGLGLVGAAGWSVRYGNLHTASIIVPATIDISERVRMNFNAGWLYGVMSERRQTYFVGAQMEAEIVRDLSLMVETFGRGYGHVGAQVGLRWNPGGGWFDLDVLAGRWIDGVSPEAVTLGLTARI
jgi:hypothetical protein